MHKQTIIDFKELGLRYLFTKPIKELKTRNLDQVEVLLREVEAYQEQGFYAVGYVSYEAAPAFEKKFAVHPAPLMGEYLLYFTIHEEVETLPFPEDYEAVDLPANWKEEVEAPAYQEAIKTIHHHIRQGDTYQVNYTVQLSQELKADPLAIYNRLVVEQKAHYNAFIQHDDVSILSISPELFFEQDDRLLTTRPMKGTTRRGLTNQEDLQESAWLKADPKNRAENMMIVDLLRNDMNRISEIGSEQVTRLCQVEQYSTVWQMTSTIALFQFLVSYGLVFLIATLYNGLGTMPEHFLAHFGLTVLIQFLSTLAWVSIISFLLYASQSITLAFVGYFIGNILLSLPALFFKDIDILHYLNLEFQYSMVQSTTATNNTLSIALGFILIFGFLGLATFKHKDL